MKLKLTPELFILQDISRKDEEEKKKVLLEVDKISKNNNRKNLILNNNLEVENEPYSNLEEKSLLRLEEKCKLNLKENLISEKKLSLEETNLNLNKKNNIYTTKLCTKLSNNEKNVKKRPKRDIIQSDIRCVQLIREKFNSNFGLTIRGGKEFNKPLIVSSIQRGSIADKCKSLFLGDLIVELNGQVTFPLNLTHEEAIKLIKLGGNKLYLTVKHLTMYNRPICHVWKRQLDTCWCNCCNKLEKEWFHKKKIVSNDCSSLSNTLLSEKNQIDSSLSFNEGLNFNKEYQYGNLNSTNIMNINEKDSFSSPSPINDEGICTTSNDALSSSLCTENSDSLSSDHYQNNFTQKQNTNFNNYQSHLIYSDQNFRDTNIDLKKTKNSYDNSYLSNVKSLEIIDNHFVDKTNNEKINSENLILSKSNNHQLHIDKSIYSSNRSEKDQFEILNKNKNPLRSSQEEEYYSSKKEILSCSRNNNDKNIANKNRKNLNLDASFPKKIIGNKHLNQDNNNVYSNNKENIYSNFNCYNLNSTLNENKNINSCSCTLTSDLNFNCCETSIEAEKNFVNCKAQIKCTVENKMTSNDKNSSFCSLCCKKLNNSSMVDIVSVNLINCYFTKYIYNTDNIRRNGMEVRWFNLHDKNKSNQNIVSESKTNSTKNLSLDVNSAILNFNDAVLAENFQNQITSYLSKLNESYMFSFNKGLSPLDRILFMGWVSLALPNSKQQKLIKEKSLKNLDSSSSTLEIYWEPKYMIIKNGDLLLYDCPPDYLINNLKYTNDTLMEFNELSELLVNKNGFLACNITLNNITKTKDTQIYNYKTKENSSLTRHLSIRGKDSTFFKNNVLDNQKVDKNKKSNKLIGSLTRNFSLKSSKENKIKNLNNKLNTNIHCTLPRNSRNFIEQNFSSSQTSFTENKQNLKRAAAASNLFNQNDFLNDAKNKLNKNIFRNEPIIFKAYQSDLRKLSINEQIDKRENCLLALTSNTNEFNSNYDYQKKEFYNLTSNLENNSIKNETILDDKNNNLSLRRFATGVSNKNTINHQIFEKSLDKKMNKENEQLLKNSLGNLDNLNDDSNISKKTTDSSVVAYLSIECAESLPQILRSWNVATLHSVLQISKKTFAVLSEGKNSLLTLDWNTGFTLHDSTNSSIKWNFKFSQLKKSSDDGNNKLWLSFQSFKQYTNQKAINLKITSFSNQSDTISSLNSSLNSLEQSRFIKTDTLNSIESNLNNSLNSYQTDNGDSLNNYSLNNSCLQKINQNTIKKSIETKELICIHLQQLLYCMHAFLSAKVTSVDYNMPN